MRRRSRLELILVACIAALAAGVLVPACGAAADPKELTVDEVLERIDAVTHDDVMEAVRRYYDPKRWSTVCIGPRPEPFRAVTKGFAWEER